MDLFREMTDLFERIHIPARVKQEFEKQRGSRKLLRTVLATYANYRVCRAVDQVSLDVYLKEFVVTGRKPRKDEGEAEAIVQASQIGVKTVIIDDKRARQWARGRSLNCCGTLGLLRLLRERDYIPEIRPKLELLYKHGRWLPKKDAEQLLSDFGERGL